MELPPCKGEALKLNSLTKEQKFTRPPALPQPRWCASWKSSASAGLPPMLDHLHPSGPRLRLTLEESISRPRTWAAWCATGCASTGALWTWASPRTWKNCSTRWPKASRTGWPCSAALQQRLDHAARSRQSMGKAKTDTVTDIPLPRVRQAAGREVRQNRAVPRVPATRVPVYLELHPRRARADPPSGKGQAGVRKGPGPCPNAARISCKRSRTGSRFIACSGYRTASTPNPIPPASPAPREAATACLWKKFQARQDIPTRAATIPSAIMPCGTGPSPSPAPNAALRYCGDEEYQGQGKFIACPRKDLQIHAPPRRRQRGRRGMVSGLVTGNQGRG